MPDMDLTKEFEFFINNQDELVKQYNGKILAIKNEKVIGVFQSELQAVLETRKLEPMGTFLVQECIPGEEAYTINYYTPRVSFTS